MILIPEVFTRVNDNFLTDGSINAFPIEFDVTHELIEGGPNSVKNRFQADFYKRFALDIVTESVFNYPYPFITEKTIRPIACKRMFIVLAPANTLALLHDKGFETFGDILDEDYDSVIDPVQRFNRVVQSIKFFLEIPLDTVKNFYKNNQNRFNHNFEILRNLRAKECQDLHKKLIDLP